MMTSSPSASIELKPGTHVAKCVLMPGDPLRAKYIADHYLENPVLFNDVRNMLGYTGTYEGKEVSVMGSGMGIPSFMLYAHELFNFFGVEAIIRVGSAGAIQDDVHVRDVVLAKDHPATGKTLSGEIVPAVDFKKLCEGIGIEHVREEDPFDVDALTKAVKEEVNREALSVIIVKAPCALLKGQQHPYVVEPLADKCVHCGACLQPGCPALTKKEDGSIAIDATMCNGCGLCMSMCKVGALQKVKR